MAKNKKNGRFGAVLQGLNSILDPKVDGAAAAEKAANKAAKAAKEKTAADTEMKKKKEKIEPLWNAEVGYFNCPFCKEPLEEGEEQCHYCGQGILWNESFLKRKKGGSVSSKNGGSVSSKNVGCEETGDSLEGDDGMNIEELKAKKERIESEINNLKEQNRKFGEVIASDDSDNEEKEFYKGKRQKNWQRITDLERNAKNVASEIAKKEAKVKAEAEAEKNVFNIAARITDKLAFDADFKEEFFALLREYSLI